MNLSRWTTREKWLLAAVSLSALALLAFVFSFFLIGFTADPDFPDWSDGKTILIALLVFVGSIVAWLRRPPGSAD